MVVAVQPVPARSRRLRVSSLPSGGVAVLRPAPARAPEPARAHPVPARTYRRRRAVAAGLVVVVVASVRAALGLLGGETLPASERPGLPVPVVDQPGGGSSAGYLVRPGDTLWSIATRVDPDGDPRPLVDRLVAERGTSTLMVGERVTLPGP